MPRKRLNIIETRLLLHRAEGWVALPYVWNADGKDATLKIGGVRKAVEFAKADGSKMAISYAVSQQEPVQTMPFDQRCGNACWAGLAKSGI